MNENLLISTRKMHVPGGDFSLTPKRVQQKFLTPFQSSNAERGNNNYYYIFATFT